MSFVANREEWQMLQDIQKYFQTEITSVNTRDWDEVESVVKGIVKSSRSGASYGASKD